MTILLLLLAHLIADFWLQTDQMVQNKIKHLKKHILHHLMTTGIVLAIIWGYQYEFQHIIYYFILPFAFIILTHLVIDLLKIKLVDSIPKSPTDNIKRLGYFLSDQALHVIMILIACILFFHMTAAAMTAELFDLLHGTSSLNPFHTLLFIIIIYILATSVCGHIVKFIIGSLPSEFANFEAELTLKKIKSLPERKKSGQKQIIVSQRNTIISPTPPRFVRMENLSVIWKGCLWLY